MRIPDTMHAMVLQKPGTSLVYRKLPVPKPGPDQVLIKVRACGVCRTDLHVVDGELPDPKLPIIPGHEIVGSVVETGTNVDSFRIGDRIGVPWVGYTCGECLYCRTGRENLCDRPKFTGYTLDGGYAEYAVADRRYCFSLPESYSDTAVAPLLCAGLIGYRSYRMAGEDAERLGIYGFGGAAHIIAQIAVYQGRKVFAFTRPGDSGAQEFARAPGRCVGRRLDGNAPGTSRCGHHFCPDRFTGSRRAARNDQRRHRCLRRHPHERHSFIPLPDPMGGDVVVRSVANLTRKDGEELLAIAPKVPVHTEVEPFPLIQANEALDRLREGKLQGAAVYYD